MFLEARRETGLPRDVYVALQFQYFDPRFTLPFLFSSFLRSCHGNYRCDSALQIAVGMKGAKESLAENTVQVTF
jgi:hypothetical protein